ncbi:MAG: hypothetical protein ACJASD_002259 [Sphingomonas echinoides]|jgi:hypothetical protein
MRAVPTIITIIPPRALARAMIITRPATGIASIDRCIVGARHPAHRRGAGTVHGVSAKATGAPARGMAAYRNGFEWRENDDD